ncbi:MAG: MGMT family protein [Candidatus Aminicenantes bacterium]|nr:MGMT family protein [Candidatus Aminicenantes bacterium]
MDPFYRHVIRVIKAIPRRKVASYGQIAALAGRPRAARQVAWVLHTSSDKERLPWHRVIGASGRISLKRGRGFAEQKRRLEAEGVRVSRAGAVDLARHLWEPPPGVGNPSSSLSARQINKLERYFRDKW